MKDVAQQAQVIDIGGAAIDDEGNPDASKLKPADWDSIANVAGKGKHNAKALVEAKQLVAAPGQKISGEENPGALDAKGVSVSSRPIRKRSTDSRKRSR